MIYGKSIILGSSSESRLLLLRKIVKLGIVVITPDINEKPKETEIPKDYSQRVAKEKMLASLEKYQSYKDFNKNAILIAADTVASCGRLILPKPQNDVEVRYCMSKISGRNVNVITSLCVYDIKDDRLSEKTVVTRFKIKHITKKDIEDMVKSHSGIGIAGGLGDFIESFVIRMVGSYSGAIGLPLYETRNILLSFGCMI